MGQLWGKNTEQKTSGRSVTTLKLQKGSITYLSIAVVVDEVAPRQDEPALLVVDWCEAFLVLRTLHHEPLPHHVHAFWLRLPIFPRHSQWRATLQTENSIKLLSMFLFQMIQ